MKANVENLLSLLKGHRQIVIPIYQRTDCWFIFQCQQLLQNILKIRKIMLRNGRMKPFLLLSLDNCYYK